MYTIKINNRILLERLNRFKDKQQMKSNSAVIDFLLDFHDVWSNADGSDRLRHIWQVQSDFSNAFHYYMNFDIDDMQVKQQLTKDYILHLMRELGEVLNEINFKLHRKQYKDVNIEHVHEELIDVQKFLLNLFLIWNLDADKFFDEFNRKSHVVKQRFESEHECSLDSLLRERE